ncbi:hypothetical protein [Candidatus Nitrosocosmicus sp. SS]|jgi:hypothetical protein|uniref:hypothetical protein n=1 Tax=Candidatus Nitrosocosmicus agrestis TaxID=2563600 RepID=UPI00122DD496|nr:hypothetical protein [Candidatus Nitrosocosmicus sp. SS]KAA2283521.1 hypothetical protein F1Z66_01155 [Candidatus Nitrosocosmicus sp. SS]KAF0869601.1 hypothetical protein E5N71_03685 [Candidatus Nitrosocosmicus sp. SS]
MAHSQNIHWENVVKNETKRFNDTDIDDVQEIKEDNVITKARMVVKDVFSIPGYFLEENNDSHKLLIKVTKDETETLNNIKA